MHSQSDSLPISRRAALRYLSAGALLSLGLWPGCATASKSGKAENFRFVVINDTHYMTPECGAWLESVVERMRRHQDIDLCLFVGDLVDKAREEDFATVRDIFATLRVPVHKVIGNHDFLTKSDRTAYDKLFPGETNYAVQHRGWQFVGLDSCQGTLASKTRIQPHTFDWLDANLATLTPAKPTVIFTHFPLGAGVNNRPLNADDLLDRFRPFNLRAVFNGHWHAYTEREWQHAIVTTNKCCSLKRGNHDKTTEKGYFLCSAIDGQVTREFIQCNA